MTAGLLLPAAAQRVSDALRRCAFTVDGVVGRAGAAAVRAAGRGEPAALRLALDGDDSVEANLVRLFLLGAGVDADGLRGFPLDDAAPLLERSGSQVRAGYDVTPYGDEDHDWWVVSDRTDPGGRPRRRDHVLGVGAAATTLAQLTVRRPVARALDLGTGCGVQALHLATHAAAVTGTDVSARALRLAATTFALSGTPVELVRGDLTAPVAGREFDLVVSNPPFVVGGGGRFDYRDGGEAGDGMSRRAVRESASVLADGGIAQLLVNWLHVRGEDWRDRVADWVNGLGCDAMLLQRDVQEPVDYVATWLDDAGERADAAAHEQWLRRLTADGVEAVGFGWVLLRRTSGPARIAVEDVPQPVDQPLGAELAGWLDRVAWLRGRGDAALLAHAFRAAPTLRRDVVDVVGVRGWERAAAVLRLDGGLRWALPTDDPTAALVAGCDGARPLGTLATVLAAALAADEDEVRAAVVPLVRALVDRGVLVP